jgi:hypothetical protein
LYSISCIDGIAGPLSRLCRHQPGRSILFARRSVRAEGRPGIDHLGWRATDFDAKIAELKQKAVQATGELRDVKER